MNRTVRTLVVGAAGQIGVYTVQDLVGHAKAEVLASDRKLDNVKRAMTDLKLKNETVEPEAFFKEMGKR